MPWTELGVGAGGSIFGAILAYMGISSRITKIEQDMAKKVDDKACEKCTENWTKQLDNIHTDIREILRRLP